MDALDKETLNFYGSNALRLSSQYNAMPNVNARHFHHAFPISLKAQSSHAKALRILDVGCGPGRDTLRLLEEGFDAWGVDPCEEFLTLGPSESSRLSGRLMSGWLGDPTLSQRLGTFDGILCSAVLHHIPRWRLVSACTQFGKLLKPGGRLHLSTPLDPLQASAQADWYERPSRASDGRLFEQLDPEFITLLFTKLGFTETDRWKEADSFGRKDRVWNHFIFTYSRPVASSSLQKIENIISEDKKTSTYKLALLRALCEIAMSMERKIEFTPRGVLIPLDRVADLWLSYYWRLLNGEAAPFQSFDGRIAFHDELSHLAARVPARSLSAFRRHLTHQADEELIRLYEGTRKKIGQTILKNPVHFTGGAKSEASEKPFFSARIGSSAAVGVRSDIWKELVVFGSWIHDALVVRWAKWCGDVAERKTGSGSHVTAIVLEALLKGDTERRDTSVCRELFSSRNLALNRTCLWTGAPLKLGDFDVDHILPFVTFRNDDLWNQAPVRSEVNRKKSDRIPSPTLLEKREVEARLLANWKAQRSAFEERFEREALRFVGFHNSKGIVIEKELFTCLRDNLILAERSDGRGAWLPD